MSDNIGREEIENRFGFHKATIEGENATLPKHRDVVPRGHRRALSAHRGGAPSGVAPTALGRGDHPEDTRNLMAEDYAAYWGLAENEAFSTSERLACAIKALKMMGAELEKHETEDLHLTTRYESNTDWQNLARQIVFDWVSEGLGESKNHPTFSKDEVYVVWYCFILGGWKALISTTLPDGRYYEVTFNRAKSEVYLDTYKKTHNNCIEIIEEN